MSVWESGTGREWLKKLILLCRKPQHRLLVVTGSMELPDLSDPRWKLQNTRVEKLQTPKELYSLSIEDTNRIILLRSLVNEELVNVEQGLTTVRDFCKKQGYTLLFAPYSFSSVDLAQLLTDARRCERDQWLADIAHWIAVSVSMGVMPCYYSVLREFTAMKESSPDTLPSASDCQFRYTLATQQRPGFKRIRKWFIGRKDLMLQKPGQYADSWIILWSFGLASQLDGQWELSPALLEGPGLIGERIRRITAANHINIPPIYMAWVYYCERKYKLCEEEGNQLIVRYPADVHEELKRLGDGIDPADLALCQNVRDLRNWLQHGDTETYGRSYYQTDYLCHRTCMTVIKKLKRSGAER